MKSHIPIERELAQQLITLECALLKPHVRASAEMLDNLLADEFIEFSATGKCFDKQHVLARLPGELMPEFHNQDFDVRLINDGLAQVTYRARLQRDKEPRPQYSNRSSLWRQTEDGWQMVFHQGTPCAEFTLKQK